MQIGQEYIDAKVDELVFSPIDLGPPWNERGRTSCERRSFPNPGDSRSSTARHPTDLPFAAPEPRVEQIPHGVAENIYPVNHHSEAKTRVNGQNWLNLHVASPFTAEHTPPASILRGQTKS